MTTFVDTNVIIDVFQRDTRWFGWSSGQIVDAVSNGGAVTSSIVIAELARDFAACDDLLRTLRAMSIEPLALDVEPAYLAGVAFTRYRARRDEDGHKRVLPDFLIGAHALTLGCPLLTRDARLYRRYFPDLTLITPETDA